MDACNLVDAELCGVSNVVRHCAIGIVLCAGRRTGWMKGLEIRAIGAPTTGGALARFLPTTMKRRDRDGGSQSVGLGTTAVGRESGGIVGMRRSPATAVFCITSDVIAQVSVFGNWMWWFRECDGGTQREVRGLEAGSNYDSTDGRTVSNRFIEANLVSRAPPGSRPVR